MLPFRREEGVFGDRLNLFPGVGGCILTADLDSIASYSFLSKPPLYEGGGILYERREVVILSFSFSRDDFIYSFRGVMLLSVFRAIAGGKVLPTGEAVAPAILLGREAS